MLHAYMFTQSGIPMLYSGDEIGQVNDYTYKDDPEKAPDSRYIHRGKFNWDLVDNIGNKESVQGKIFQALDKLEAIRRNEAVFNTDAEVYTKDYSDQSGSSDRQEGGSDDGGSAGLGILLDEEKAVICIYKA